MRLEKNPETDIRAQVMELLAWMGLGDIHDKLPGTLSAGAQQRLAMARAIINRPSLVLADEPTSHVDDRITHRLIRMLEELNNLGTTIVVATNNAGLIQRFPHPCLWLQPNGLVRLNQAELAALSQDSAPQPPAAKTPALSVNPLTMEQADLQNDPPAPIPIGQNLNNYYRPCAILNGGGDEHQIIQKSNAAAVTSASGCFSAISALVDGSDCIFGISGIGRDLVTQSFIASLAGGSTAQHDD